MAGIKPLFGFRAQWISHWCGSSIPTTISPNPAGFTHCILRQPSVDTTMPLSVDTTMPLSTVQRPSMTPVPPSITPVRPSMTPVRPSTTPIQPSTTPIQLPIPTPPTNRPLQYRTRKRKLEELVQESGGPTAVAVSFAKLVSRLSDREEKIRALQEFFRAVFANGLLKCAGKAFSNARQASQGDSTTDIFKLATNVLYGSSTSMLAVVKRIVATFLPGMLPTLLQLRMVTNKFRIF